LKKILILYPHFPPSNLAGVHRARLFAQHLPTFGWEPVVLTVHENFYEEKLDYNLVKLLPENLRIEKVKAYSIGKFRIVGDIGLRGFFQLYKKAKQLIKAEHFDFLYIPIPSFYCALLGRKLHASTGIKYGIDYIDPWVHNFPGSEKKFSRHWFSTMLAKFLEPIAVKKVSLITGVAEGYYQSVLERNPHLKNIVTGAMPYGGEKMDHEIVESLDIEPYLFRKSDNKIQLVYAGAMLPKAYEPLEKIFKVISSIKANFSDVEFHFIGTGKKADDINGYNIKPLAEKYGLWNDIVFEYPKRIPYLDVLVHLNIADGIFILGSTEPHYTPSKSYQAILSKKPILAVLHEQSSAVEILDKANVGVVISFAGQNDLEKIANTFASAFETWLEFRKVYSSENINLLAFNKFSAFEVSKTLASLLHVTISKK
jgi:glycosyltransferase involved in cell wall biosynthesis